MGSEASLERLRAPPRLCVMLFPGSPAPPPTVPTVSFASLRDAPSRELATAPTDSIVRLFT